MQPRATHAEPAGSLTTTGEVDEAAAAAHDATTHGAGEGAERCGNCGAALAGRYCSQCGEKRPDAHDYTMAGIAHEVLHNFTHLDGKIARSVRSLLTRPGELTEAYFSERRGRFTKPLALFVTLNLVFFVLVPHTGLFRENFDRYAYVRPGESTPRRVRTLLEHAAASREPLPVYRERFDGNLTSYKKSLLLYLIPVFGLASYVVHLATGGRSRRRRYLAEDVVHAVHTTAFFLVVSIFVFVPVVGALVVGLRALSALVPAARDVARAIDSNAGTGALYCSALGWYLVVAERRFFGASRAAALLRGAVLVTVFFTILLAFRAWLFWAALWST